MSVSKNGALRKRRKKIFSPVYSPVVTMCFVFFFFFFTGTRDLKNKFIPAVIGVVDVQFGDLVAFGPFDVRERIGQLFLVMFVELFIEHGHLVG